jgi:hypothetical protein
MVLEFNSAQGYFRESLEMALERSTIKLNESVQIYIVNMLSEFLRSEVAFAGTDYGEQFTMALLLDRALSSEHHEAIRIFRHLGDSSLYLLGFFGESQLRRPVPKSYYRDMGSQAYWQASVLSRAQVSSLFCDLSMGFDDIVKVLELMAHCECLN